MKLKRIICLPFAALADVVSLGNMGDRSFCQQVFDAEERERREEKQAEAALKLLKILYGNNFEKKK